MEYGGGGGECSLLWAKLCIYATGRLCPNKVGWLSADTVHLSTIFGFGGAGWAVHACGGGCVVLCGPGIAG